MSFTNREDRGKLRGQRLKISSSNITTSSSNSNEFQSTRQGIKRNFCSNSFEQNRNLDCSKNSPDSANLTKNLANNRLQRLKQSLNLDLAKDTIQPENGKSCRLSGESSNNPNSSKVHEISPPVVRKSTNIYENLAEWATPESPDEKNLANNRLKRLKKCILNTAHENSIPTPTISPKNDHSQEMDNNTHTSPLLRSREVGMKRSASDSTCDPDTSQPPQKKSFLDIQAFPPSTKEVRDLKNISIQVYADNQITPSGSSSKESVSRRIVKYKTNVNNNVNNNVTKLERVPGNNLNVDRNISSGLLNNSANSTHVSDRIDRIKRNSVGDRMPKKCHDMMSPSNLITKSPNSTSISSPISHKNSDLKQSNTEENTSKVKIISNIVVNRSPYKSAYDNNEASAKLVTSVFKPFIPTPKHDSFIQNPLMTDQDIDSYRGKMALTASWVEYHTNPDIQKELVLQSTETVGKVEEKVPEPVEEMEWANAEPDEEVLPPEPISIKDKPPKLKDICIVVDTNIFISNLSKLKEIVSMKSKGNIKPILYIPWMVIQELDFMKDTGTKDKLKSNIVSSIHFINKGLQEEDPHVIGQTVREVECQKQIGKSPDDKIISCCMQVSEKYETVILLSNDMNLKNKALINSITACSVQEIESKISEKLANNKRVRYLMQKMSILCSSVICECARDTYGTAWNKMHMLSDAPWSFTECLKRIKKYWKTVFQDRILKQCINTCDDLYKFIKCNKSMSDDSKEFLKFVELCITLCVYFKDIEEYRESVQKTLDDIKKLD